MDSEPGIRVPAGDLDPEALRGVIEEFVTRDGTDLAEAESKIKKVERLLERGEVEIWFDEESRTCNILPVAR